MQNDKIKQIAKNIMARLPLAAVAAIVAGAVLKAKTSEYQKALAIPIKK